MAGTGGHGVDCPGRVTRSIIAACATLMVALPAFAQSELKPVDQGFEDQGPLAASRRLAPTDLRAPSAFDRVFRVTNGGRDTGSFARVQGALVAVFPRSQYNLTSKGLSIPTPAGTVFHIGAPRDPGPGTGPKSPIGSAPRPSIGDRLDTRVAPPVLERPTVPRPVARASDAPLSLFTDETYRARRVASLLDRALGRDG